MRVFMTHQPSLLPPHEHRPALKLHRASEADRRVIIVGAGPVGLALAGFLSRRGIACRVIEKRRQGPDKSMAIGVMPATLRLLDELGVRDAFVEAGLPIVEAEVHGAHQRLGTVRFDGLRGDHRYILSLPQAQMVRLLESRVSQMPGVTIERGVEVQSVCQDDQRVRLRLVYADGRIEKEVDCPFLIGCDGNRSAVRSAARITARWIQTPHRFAMLDMQDHDRFGHKAALVFNPEGTVESFPMPGGLRRWILQLYDESHDVLSMSVPEICADINRFARTSLNADTCLDVNRFHLRTLSVDRYHAGRVVLAGDAAHVVSPLGGQGLNVGFADAYALAETLRQIWSGQARNYRAGFARYERRRRRAYRAANRWANIYTWFGTRRGSAWSRVRDVFCRSVLFRWPIAAALPAQFAMMRVPGITVNPPEGIFEC